MNLRRAKKIARRNLEWALRGEARALNRHDSLWRYPPGMRDDIRKMWRRMKRNASRRRPPPTPYHFVLRSYPQLVCGATWVIAAASASSGAS